MARHKRKSKKHHSKRRHSRMGAVDFTNIISVVAGAVVAGYVDKVVPETVNPKVTAGGKIALGVVLPMFAKSGSMKNILAGAGAGMIAVGSVDLLKGFGMLSGDEKSSDDVLEISLNGDMDVLAGDDISVINASVLAEDDLSVINGYDEESDEY